MDRVTDQQVASEFRVIQAVLEEPSIPSVRADGPVSRSAEDLAAIEPSFSEHQSVTGLPFVATYYKLDKVFQDIMVPDRTNVSRVNAWVAKRLQEGGYQDTAEAAASILKGLEDKLGLNDYQDPYYKLDKLGAYVRALEPGGRPVDLRRQLLAGQRNRETNGRFR